MADAEVLLLFGRCYFLFLDSLQFEATVNNQLARRRAGGRCGRAGREAEDSRGTSYKKNEKAKGTRDYRARGCNLGRRFNHCFRDIRERKGQQGKKKGKQMVIGNDIMVGRNIKAPSQYPLNRSANRVLPYVRLFTVQTRGMVGSEEKVLNWEVRAMVG